MLLSQAERILLQDLGDGGEGDVLRYLALRTAWMACVLAVSMYAVMAVSYGAIIPVLSGAVLLALWGPRSVLDLAWEVRRRELMVEKPIVFAMLGAGARATREVVGVLGNSADILCGKLNKSTLAYGVLRARWRARIVGSWYCALNADRQDAAVGPIVADALSQLGTVIQHDCGDVGQRLQVLTKQAQEQLAVDLQRHRRLIVFKVGVLIVASLVGVALISSYSLQNFWGG
jgi:hypothetical protein